MGQAHFAGSRRIISDPRRLVLVQASFLVSELEWKEHMLAVPSIERGTMRLQGFSKEAGWRKERYQPGEFWAALRGDGKSFVLCSASLV